MDELDIGGLGRPGTVSAIALRWNDQRDQPGYDLSLELARDGGPTTRAFFEGVSSLRIEQSMSTVPVTLQAFDHRADGWERHARIYVANSEQDADFSFYCSRMRIEPQDG